MRVFLFTTLLLTALSGPLSAQRQPDSAATVSLIAFGSCSHQNKRQPILEEAVKLHLIAAAGRGLARGGHQAGTEGLAVRVRAVDLAVAVLVEPGAAALRLGATGERGRVAAVGAVLVALAGRPLAPPIRPVAIEVAAVGVPVRRHGVHVGVAVVAVEQRAGALREIRHVAADGAEAVAVLVDALELPVATGVAEAASEDHGQRQRSGHQPRRHPSDRGPHGCGSSSRKHPESQPSPSWRLPSSHSSGHTSSPSPQRTGAWDTVSSKGPTSS